MILIIEKTGNILQFYHLYAPITSFTLLILDMVEKVRRLEQIYLEIRKYQQKTHLTPMIISPGKGEISSIKMSGSVFILS